MKVIREVTPKGMKCGGATACPAIFEVSSDSFCGSGGSCPAIFKDEKGSYILIGKLVDHKELGLSERVGKDEVVVEVPKKLIDEKLG